MYIFYLSPKISTYSKSFTYDILLLGILTNGKENLLNLKKYSIIKQYKFFSSYVLFLVIILSGISFIFVNQSTTKNVYSHAKSLAKDLSAEIEHTCEKTDSIITNLLLDSDVENLMISPYSSKSPKYLGRIANKISFYQSTVPEIVDITLSSDQMNWSNIFTKEAAAPLRNKIQNHKELQTLGLLSPTFYSSQSPHNPAMVFGQNIYGTQNSKQYGQYLGCIFLSLDPSKLFLPYMDIYGEKTLFLLADGNGNFFTLAGPEEEVSKLTQFYLEKKDSYTTKKGTFFSTSDYLIDISPISSTGYQLISAFDHHQINKEILRTTLLLICIIIISCLILLLFMYLLLQNIVTPLGQMAAHIQSMYTTSNYKDPFPIFDGCEEIHTLSKTFHSMMEEKERLTDELHQATITIYEAQLQKKEAELEYLRSQINPHFLYNTLETIKNISLEHGLSDVADVTNSLSKLLRYNVKGDFLVPLEQEICIVSAYLKIQNARFGNQIHVIYSILDETKKIKVMKFLLQPLVENSILHGFSSNGTQGTLFIGAHVENDVLLINIQDDGQGIDAHTLNTIHENLSIKSKSDNFSENHVGIYNVHYRIQLAYGDEYGLSIKSQQYEGTRITLRLPINP